MTIVIPGEPVPKGRPRFTKTGRTYTPKRTAEAEERIGWEMKAAGAQVDAEARFSVNLIVKSRKAKVDLDNVLKLYLDAGNGVVWADDAQVDQFVALRDYNLCACGPQTEFSWWTL